MQNLKSLGISSTVQKIEDLRFYEFPRTMLLEACKIARSSDTTVYMDPAGKMYCGAIRHAGHYTFGRHSLLDSLLRCACTLKVITTTELRKHFKDADAHVKERRRIEAASEFLTRARKLGIKLNKTQLKALKLPEHMLKRQLELQ